MNNKLREIADRVNNNVGEIAYSAYKRDITPKIANQLLLQEILSGLVEYARSKAPKEENEFCKECGRPKHERAMMLQRIEQDLQSLNN